MTYAKAFFIALREWRWWAKRLVAFGALAGSALVALGLAVHESNLIGLWWLGFLMPAGFLLFCLTLMQPFFALEIWEADKRRRDIARLFETAARKAQHNGAH